jgi:hypothetical protein
MEMNMTDNIAKKFKSDIRKLERDMNLAACGTGNALKVADMRDALAALNTEYTKYEDNKAAAFYPTYTRN